MARIPYPDLTNLPERARAALDSMVTPLNLIRMCAHAPVLLAPIVTLSTTILSRLRLSPQHREMLILRTAWKTGCDYVLAQHRTIGRQLGLDTEKIEAVCGDPERAVLRTDERELLRAADEIVDETTVNPELLDKLAARLGPEQLVELFVIVGHYRMLSGLLNGLDVDVDPQGEKFVALSKSNGDTRQEETSR